MMTTIAAIILAMMTALAGTGAEAVVPCVGNIKVEDYAIEFRDDLDKAINELEVMTEENAQDFVDLEHEISVERTGDNTYKYHFDFTVGKSFDLNVRFVEMLYDKTTETTKILQDDGTWKLTNKRVYKKGELIEDINY